MVSSELQKGTGNHGLSKWQYALIIGTPVAAGVAYWYYRRLGDKKKKSDGSNRGPAKNPEVNKTESNQTKWAPEANSSTKKEVKADVALPKDNLERAKSHKNQGNKFFKEGKFDKAIECYTEAIAVCPKEFTNEIATFYQNRAAAFENLKNFAEVILDCSKAIELNKTYVKALQRRAKAYELKDELKKCLEDITAVCILEGFQNQSSLLATDRVLKKLGKVHAKEVMKNRGVHLPSKHFIYNYFESFCEDPVGEDLRKFRQEGSAAKASSELSEYEKALKCVAEERFEEVVGHCTAQIQKGASPETNLALLLRATFHMLGCAPHKAKEDLKALLDKGDAVETKVRVNAMVKLGTLKLHAEQTDEALLEFGRAAKLDERNADVFLHRGQVLLMQDLIEDTLKDMEKSAELRPDFPSALAQKCYVQYRCAMRNGDLQLRKDALDGFQQLHEKFPRFPESFLLYAQLLTELQEFEKAQDYFRKAQEIDPSDPNVYVHMGLMQIQWKQDFNEAVSLFEQAIRQDSKCQFAFESLGSLQVQRGLLQEGLEAFEKAIQLAQTETELAHLCALRDAAEAQASVAARLGIPVGPGLH
ncbi:mitochondrial import receptor subunit TOM70-like [Ornithodoros turicata]|uniref:mitochondrial import receptor subunit TOM70-like n=1 Tax=Ornithodoros turicata TaxID=34597 RepID=UPI003139C6C5